MPVYSVTRAQPTDFCGKNARFTKYKNSAFWNFPLWFRSKWNLLIILPELLLYLRTNSRVVTFALNMKQWMIDQPNKGRFYWTCFE